ncbi:MAG TPA: TonB family protein [Thermoanaerobaculia bacterium]|nr:TonB family protein [Thermoanaerobaculia bacterium]
MQDRVAEVLAQRATLDRGAGIGIALSILFHGALAGAVVYAALHATAPEAATMVSIRFAKMPAAAPAPAAPKRAEARPPAAPAPIEEPKIVEPKPVAEKPPETPKKPEKNTVPLSPFGQSTKKGSEAPAPAKPPAAPAPGPAAVPGTTTDVAVGGSGITGVEGGDFPHALYLERMHRLIGDKWIRPSVNGPTAVIFLRIQRDGTITEARIATPSGNSTFDRAALSAVRSASPLNPLPFAYSGKELGIYLTFR